MKLVVFGLSVSSSCGNGHARLWRGLIHALARLGHSVVFFEWNAPHYAANRDCHDLPNGRLHIYDTWVEAARKAEAELRDADVAMVTSYCAHGVRASELVLGSAVPAKVFYDLDTPITLDRLARGESVPYLGPAGLADFDLVLSYAGGSALGELQRVLGARRVAPLCGSVDPSLHSPRPPRERYAADLSYLGTYADERELAVERLFLEPAKRLPWARFALGGTQYPSDFAWSSNIHFHHHVPPADHAAFYCSARLNLNVTRAPMAAMGHCPSGRLFEAAASGGALVTDPFPGLESFYEPGSEILVAETTEQIIEALALPDDDLWRMARRARERTLDQHTVDDRAQELIAAIASIGSDDATLGSNAAGAFGGGDDAPVGLGA